MDVSKLMEATAQCLPEDARRIAEKCLKEKKSKSFEWLPENLSFRYVIAGELVGGRNKTSWWMVLLLFLFIEVLCVCVFGLKMWLNNLNYL